MNSNDAVAEAFWQEYSHLLIPSGNGTADSERLKGYENALSQLSASDQYKVRTWKDYGRDRIPLGSSNTTPSTTSTTASMIAQSAAANSVSRRIDSVYSFASNDQRLDEISMELNSCADEIRQYITDIFAKVNELSNYWTGEAYDQFTSNCEMYRESLEGLVVLLEAFSKHFNLLYIDTDSLITEIKGYLHDCDYSLSSSNGYYGSN
ncbi:MAG: hypothetical protein IJ475_02960 [Bacilli bacterium]|nr:hypothetical protein [Bacilli bacterium]